MKYPALTETEEILHVYRPWSRRRINKFLKITTIKHLKLSEVLSL